jgi:hypothetical protein
MLRLGVSIKTILLSVVMISVVVPSVVATMTNLRREGEDLVLNLVELADVNVIKLLLPPL